MQQWRGSELLPLVLLLGFTGNLAGPLSSFALLHVPGGRARKNVSTEERVFTDWQHSISSNSSRRQSEFSLIMNIMLLAVTTIGDEEAEAQVKVDHGMTRAMAKKQARALPRALAM